MLGWSTWESACSVTCGGSGTATRQRSCVDTINGGPVQEKLCHAQGGGGNIGASETVACDNQQTCGNSLLTVMSRQTLSLSLNLAR